MLCTADESASSSSAPALTPVQHFHSQHSTLQQHTAPSLPQKPGGSAGGQAGVQQLPHQSGPDLLLTWQDQQRHLGVHHLYDCQQQVKHLKHSCCKCLLIPQNSHHGSMSSNQNFSSVASVDLGEPANATCWQAVYTNDFQPSTNSWAWH